jgi:hypothetical protein
MDILKKALFHYAIGVLISASIVFLIIVFDYFFNGYYIYPNLYNFVKVCLVSGLGFGLTHYISTLFEKTKKI